MQSTGRGGKQVSLHLPKVVAVFGSRKACWRLGSDRSPPVVDFHILSHLHEKTKGKLMLAFNLLDSYPLFVHVCVHTPVNMYTYTHVHTHTYIHNKYCIHRYICMRTQLYADTDRSTFRCVNAIPWRSFPPKDVFVTL